MRMSTASSPERSRCSRPGLTKHGFNEFRENPGFALGDRVIASLAHTHIAISRGLARYLEEVEGFDGASFEIVHYGIEPDGVPRPFSASGSRLLCVGRLIPIKGHIVLLRAFAEARRPRASLVLEIAGRRSSRARAARAREGAGDRRRGALTPSSATCRYQRAIEEVAVVSFTSLGEASAWSPWRQWSLRARS